MDTFIELWGQGEDGYPFGFEIQWWYGRASAHAQVYPCIGRAGDGLFTFHKQGYPEVDATVKYDGDYQADMHCTGRDRAKLHADLVLYVYDRAMELMAQKEASEH